MYRSKLTFSAYLSLFVILSFSSISQNITGDSYVCKGAEEIYTISAPSTSDSPWNIIPKSAGQIISQHSSQLTVVWTTNPGTYSIEYSTDSDTYSIPVTVEETINLACNKTIVVSMDNSCSADIFADMILEGMQYDRSSYDVTLTIEETGEIVGSPVLYGEHVGQLMEVKVTQSCTQNSCWGYIVAEDKTEASLETGSHIIHCYEDYTPHSMNLFPMQGHMELTHERTYSVSEFNYCKDMMLSYEDVFSESDCNGAYGEIIYRHWTLVPNSGHIVKATDTLYMEASNMDEMSFPQDWDGNQSLNCFDADQINGWAILENGFPSPEYTGKPIGPICGNVQINHYDTKFESCNSSSYKLLRKWEVVDWCSGDVVEHDQYIHVQDRRKPIVQMPESWDYEMSWDQCYATIKVPSPLVDDCSAVNISIAYKFEIDGGSPFEDYKSAGVSSMDHEGWFTIQNLEATSESLWVIFTIWDECDNESQIYTTIELKDKVSPIAICDEHTTIGLGEYGYAWADQRAFDDGSWDNCEIDSFLLKKLDGYTCEEQINWSERVKFCCEDLNQIITVELKVIDKQGNYNSCQTKVTLQDNEPPVVKYCPADTIVSCDFNKSDFENFRAAEFKDFCSLTMTDSISFNLNECGIGQVQRFFEAADGGGNRSSCVQNITVGSSYSLDSVESKIIWPLNLELDMCTVTGVLPEFLEEGYNVPRYEDFSCSEPVITYEDTRFHANDEGVCQKILREWTIVDWCHFDPSTSFNGSFSHTQVIKLIDLEKPVITFGCDDVDILDAIPEENCLYRIPLLQAEATDNGCDSTSLQWRYTIDYYNDGTADKIEARSQIVDELFDLGTHKITWYVSDACGNDVACSQLIHVFDNKAPTPYCVTSLSVTISDETKDVEIWAADFNLKSEDNCGSDSLSFSFSEGEYIPNMTLSCDDLNNLSIHLIDVRVYVSDEFGNAEYCNSTINLQGTQVNCEEESSFGIIHGEVKTWTGQAVSDALLSIGSSYMTDDLEFMTQDDGAYNFDQLLMEELYILKITKQNDLLAGLSTADLVKIQQHILAIKQFESPYQIIAADANGSGTISSTDLIQLRAKLLGFQDLSISREWVFISDDFNFLDPLNPFPLEEDIMINHLDKDVMTHDVTAIKVGDVNGSYLSSENRDINGIALTYSQHGDITSFTFKDDVSLFGLQLSIEINSESDLSLESKFIKNVDEYSIFKSDSKTILNISWIPTEMVQLLDNDIILELKGVSKDTEIQISNKSFSSELYRQTDGNEFKEIKIRLEKEMYNDNALQVFQNEPNPFNHTTDIPIILQHESELSIILIDANGSIIMREKKIFPSGKSKWTVNTNSKLSEGIYLYQISNDDHVITKKMIMIR